MIKVQLSVLFVLKIRVSNLRIIDLPSIHYPFGLRLPTQRMTSQNGMCRKIICCFVQDLDFCFVRQDFVNKMNDKLEQVISYIIIFYTETPQQNF